MIRTKILMYAFIVWTNLSCIRLELPFCPPLQIDVTVKDKNYYNIDKDSEWRVDENLSFKDYVSTLYYIIKDIETGDIIKEQTTFTVEEDSKDFLIEMPASLPFGKYEIIAWGNLKTERPIENGNVVDDKNESVLGEDIYVAVDTLYYTPENSSHALSLERTKGRLVIMVENLQDKPNVIESRVDNIFRFVAKDLSYTGKTEVNYEVVPPATTSVVSSSVYCPTVGGEYSVVDLKIVVSDGMMEETLHPEEVHVTLHRNAITILRYVYQPLEKDFVIYSLVNDVWEEVNDMEIQ